MFKDDLLIDRVALVTGGGSGLGKAIAQHLVRYGAKVAIIGRRQPVLQAAATELSRQPDDVLPVACDVRYQDEVENTVEVVEKAFGRIDYLINNAAGNFVYPTARLTPNSFKLIIDTVLMGAINFTLTLGKRWIQAGQGATVLNILATYADTGSAFVVPSACAKAGLENLTRSLAAEWGRYQIRLIGIAPGPFLTEGATKQLRLNENLLPNTDLLAFVTQRIPLGRFGRLEELANLAVFLVSPYADFINGEIIRIDGGEIPYLSGEFCFLSGVPEERWDGEASRLKRS